LSQKKVTVVGAGNVGATTAFLIAVRQMADVVLLDIAEDTAKGKALDIDQGRAALGSDVNVTAAADWTATAGSNVVVITGGAARKPNMSREQLLEINVKIVAEITANAVRYSPEAIILVVTNPLDAMVHVAAKVSGLDKARVMGMSGELDCSRFNHFIADALSVAPSKVQSVILGRHGDDMVPLVSRTTVNGKALTDLMDAGEIEAIVNRTKKAGGEIVALLGFSAYYAVGAATVKMLDAILNGPAREVVCCSYAENQYGVGGYFVGVPAILGPNGIEEVIELELGDSEKTELEKSVQNLHKLIAQTDQMLARL